MNINISAGKSVAVKYGIKYIETSPGTHTLVQAQARECHREVGVTSYFYYSF